LWPVQGREPLAQLDAGDLSELSALVRDRLRYYNRVRRHSILGMRPPLEFVRFLSPPEEEGE
jgi:transposase InsO family protein